MSDNETNPRRAFLGRSAAATGGIVLALSGVAAADEAPAGAENAAAKADLKANAKVETVLKLDEHGDLAKIGGSEIVDTAAGKIIVAHVAADKYVACSAICTHKGCEIGYAHDDQQFVCPCHFAAFALDGTVKRGPAKKNLKSYAAGATAVVTLKLD